MVVVETHLKGSRPWQPIRDFATAAGERSGSGEEGVPGSRAVDAKGRDRGGAQACTQPARPAFRGPAAVRVAMEACSSAHHWGRAPIELGHEVRLLPPAHVKPPTCAATKATTD